MGKLLLAFARSRLTAKVVGWVFAHASFLLPVKRLYESPTLIAFHHPQPAYQTHCLLIPKKAISGVPSLTAADGNTLVEVVLVSQQIARVLNLTQYQLVVNAGAYQAVPQLHFHLISQALEYNHARTFQGERNDES